jgi:hypothetical protein
VEQAFVPGICACLRRLKTFRQPIVVQLSISAT